MFHEQLNLVELSKPTQRGDTASFVLRASGDYTVTVGMTVVTATRMLQVTPLSMLLMLLMMVCLISKGEGLLPALSPRSMRRQQQHQQHQHQHQLPAMAWVSARSKSGARMATQDDVDLLDEVGTTTIVTAATATAAAINTAIAAVINTAIDTAIDAAIDAASVIATTAVTSPS